MSYAYLYKIIIIGDSAVGKSCLLLRYVSSQFKTQHDITIGVEYGTKIISCDGKNIRLQIWDTAGSETFKSITRSYYKGVAGALLVFDLSHAESFKHVEEWIQEVKEVASASITLMLVGNKSDIEEREVSTETAQNFAKLNGMEYIETSAKTGTNVKEAFDEMTKAIYLKVKNGIIDVTQESSGVKLGTEVDINHGNAPVKKRLSNAVAPAGGCGSC
eukprot:TRINITY_DN3971_c0_g1_i6.p1 TRINITY_DN3971_c0_g1~~TRINITY_DN3971_c0_g1_i6.p1  ORF type:complete len:217 (+),score=56.14 TRINITY_DN3971_c0_g1_i6:40-690(+)